MKHKILYESPYEYGVFSSEDRRSGRFYDCNGVKLPSVTTILSNTKEGDFLKKWIDKVGEEEAERIRTEAATGDRDWETHRTRTETRTVFYVS